MMRRCFNLYDFKADLARALMETHSRLTLGQSLTMSEPGMCKNMGRCASNAKFHCVTGQNCYKEFHNVQVENGIFLFSSGTSIVLQLNILGFHKNRGTFTYKICRNRKKWHQPMNELPTVNRTAITKISLSLRTENPMLKVLYSYRLELVVKHLIPFVSSNYNLNMADDCF